MPESMIKAAYAAGQLTYEEYLLLLFNLHCE